MLAAAKCEAPARAAVLEAIALGIVPHERFLPADFPDREAFLGDALSRPLAGLGAPLRQRDRAARRRDRDDRDPREAGLVLALVTSSSGPLARFSTAGASVPRSTTIIGREDVRRIKPDPEPLLLALVPPRARSPQEVLHVGDTPLDVRAGLAAGLPTIGVLTGAGTETQLREAGAAHVLPSLAELAGVPRAALL